MQLRKEGRAIGRTKCLSWGFRSSFIWSVAASCIYGLASKVLLGDLEVTLTYLAYSSLNFMLAFTGNSSTLTTSEALLCAYSANIVAILEFAFGAGATSGVAATLSICTGWSSGSFFFLYLGLIVRFVIMLLILYIVKSSSRSLF